VTTAPAIPLPRSIRIVAFCETATVLPGTPRTQPRRMTQN